MSPTNTPQQQAAPEDSSSQVARHSYLAVASPFELTFMAFGGGLMTAVVTGLLFVLGGPTMIAVTIAVPCSVVAFILVARLRLGKAVKLMAFVAGIGLLPMAAGAFLLTVDSPLSLDRMEFDSVLWKENLPVEGEDPIRLRMIDDLLNRHDLRGKTIAEVESLLGPSARRENSPYELVFYLGLVERLDTPGYKRLILNTDKVGLITDYRVLVEDAKES